MNDNSVHDWLDRFSRAAADSTFGDAGELFRDEVLWRDLVSLTWNIHTAEGKDAVLKGLSETVPKAAATNWARDGEPTITDGITESWFTFETAVARGRGQVRLVEGKALTLYTGITELKGHEEKSGPSREKGIEHGAVPGRVSYGERREAEVNDLGTAVQPYCLIVGAGQCGIGLGARLRRLGVPTLIIDRHEQTGDAWRDRYDSLCLHDPVWYDHMPYLPFPDDWPVFTPKDRMGDWLEMYARVLELNIWNSTECQHAEFDETDGTWRVEVIRNGEPITLRPTQLVFAAGLLGKPRLPVIPGAESFAGVQYHSNDHRSASGFRGKKAVVLGASNSAHDICIDLWEQGADVTMIQRSSIHVVRSHTLVETMLGPLYSEAAVAAGIDVDQADLIRATVPYRLLPMTQIPLWEAVREQESDFYARLSAVGFQLDFAEDGGGVLMKAMRTATGFYIDEGASGLIADRQIGLRHGSIAEIKKHSLVLTDGEELPADVIVYATGYESGADFIADVVSPEIADRVGRIWGLGAGMDGDPGPWEGELRNMWKPTAQPNFWVHGGGLALSRFHSIFLALQLKARFEKIDTPVYGLAPVHHTR
jgi:putative flavoprotein involved in K+ transport